MRPSSIRTGTSTCTSRNGDMRIFRMYASRLIRSAARSNWFWTIARPDIGARLGRGAVMAWLAGVEPPACEARAGILGFVQGLRGVRRPLAARAAVRQHADNVGRYGRPRRPRRPRPHFAGVLDG